MSTRRERDHITSLARTAWADVVDLLADRGETWPDTDVTTWGPGLKLAMTRAQALAEASALIGGPDLHQIAQRHNDP